MKDQGRSRGCFRLKETKDIQQLDPGLPRTIFFIKHHYAKKLIHDSLLQVHSKMYLHQHVNIMSLCALLHTSADIFSLA